MRQITVIAVSALLVGTLWAPAASAGGDWVFGGAFRIGGVHFQIGFHTDHRDRYYTRTRSDLGRYYHGRARCNRACYTRGDYTYHDRSCPLVQAYFRDYGYGYDSVFDRYAPDYGGYGYGRGYRDDYRDGYRDRYNRGYSRYDDRHYRGHRRHDRRHRDHCPYH